MSTEYAASRVSHDGATFWLHKSADRKELVIEGAAAPVLDAFSGSAQGNRFIAPANAENALALRNTLPWLKPRLWGLATSAGTGDRLGLCTPGHVRAFADVAGVNPVFAQQSTREMGRTHRTPRNVLDDATWGAFQGGWTGGVGGDADHQKTEESLSECAEAGFVFFTIDPGDEMDMAAHDDEGATVRAKAEALDLSSLDTSLADVVTRYAGTTVELESGPLTLDEESVVRAMAKAGPGLVRGLELINHVKSLGVTHEFEFAIDETDKPTTLVEHVVVVRELQRLGVELASFAPRWVGQFEKGVEYIGSRDALAQNFQQHAEISRALGPYKLSLHSGSDKFSIYPLFAEATRGASHLKTAGTSWIEALRVVARHEFDLLREILALSLASFEENRHSYHLSCDPSKIPTDPSDDQLDDLVTAIDSRQVMHVGYGAVLEKFGPEIKQTLDDHEEELYEIMHQHFLKHVRPFGSQA
ncbi:MAG: tagaturonate epimerase family protein [Propionibacteriaceae bacterium]